MKRVPHLFRLCQRNWGGDWLFRTAAPGSNATASGVSGWRRQGQCDNHGTAQPISKAEFPGQLHTAKRMIYFRLIPLYHFFLAKNWKTFKKMSGHWAVSIPNFIIRIRYHANLEEKQVAIVKTFPFRN
jgi:hypothetical protein